MTRNSLNARTIEDFSLNEKCAFTNVHFAMPGDSMINVLILSKKSL